MFTAWFGDGSPPAPATLVGPLHLVGKVSVASDGPVAWAMAGPGTNMSYDPDTGIRVWAWARIDNRTQLRAQLAQHEDNDAALILGGYLRWGIALPQHLTGDFSVCIFDPRDGVIHAFRDPIGVRPLTVGQSAGTTVVTTAAGALWNLPGFVSTPDAHTIVEHATQLRAFSMAAAHPQATRVIPGTVLSCRSGTYIEERYHRFEGQSEWSHTPSNQWVDDFREVLDAAVVARLPAQGPIGIEFSGGLDSVGIASLITDTDPDAANRLWAYGLTLLSEEEKTMRTSADALGIATLNTEVPRPQRTTIVDTESLLGEPVGHQISLRFSQALSQCADAGGEVMFAGHGGDQCVTHPARQAPHEWVHHRDFVGAARYMLPRSGWRRIAHTAKLAVQGVHFDALQVPSLEELSRSLHLRIDVMKEVAAMTEGHTRKSQPLNASSVNADIVTAEGLIQPLKATYWSRRAEECNTVASLFGMTYAFPLLDAAVVQQYLKTPTVHKYRHGLGRYLFREVLGNSMPDVVRWAPSKYMGEPIRRQPRQPQPAVAVSIHPLLADLMPAGAGLPPESRDRNYPTQVHMVNAWLNDHFPASD